MTAALALLLAAAVAEPSFPDASRLRLEVVAHIEPGVTLDRDDVAEIASGVRQIWRPHADVYLALSTDPMHVVADDTVQLNITSRMLREDHALGLGWIEFVDGLPQSTITVSVSAATRLMQYGTWRGRSFDTIPLLASRIFLRRALTRAVAHEVGHYLLRTREHARVGLMRPSLTVEDIMDRRPGVDRLEPPDIARLREVAPLHAARASENR